MSAIQIECLGPVVKFLKQSNGVKKDTLFSANFTTLAGKWTSLSADLYYQNRTTVGSKYAGKALASSFEGIGEESGIQTTI